MKRPRIISGIALAIVILFVLGTGVALAYNTGYRTSWYQSSVWGQAGPASAAVGSGAQVPTAAPTAATAATTYVVPPCPDPGWCWDSANSAWVAPARSARPTTPPAASSKPAPSPRGYDCPGSGCCW